MYTVTHYILCLFHTDFYISDFEILNFCALSALDFSRKWKDTLASLHSLQMISVVFPVNCSAGDKRCALVITVFKHFVYIWKVVKGLSCICLAREQNLIIYFIHQRWQQNATLWLESVFVVHCLACQCVKMKENDFSGMTSQFFFSKQLKPAISICTYEKQYEY